MFNSVINVYNLQGMHPERIHMHADQDPVNACRFAHNMHPDP
jgi:hypothetical protein